MKNILVVDDSLFIRTILKKMLTQLGYNVIAEAENGLDAVYKYKKYRPDIVTMDINMEVMNGVEASGEILKINPKANILVISASCQKKNIITMLEQGVKDFIVKPVNPNLLLSSLSSF